MQSLTKILAASYGLNIDQINLFDCINDEVQSLLEKSDIQINDSLRMGVVIATSLDFIDDKSQSIKRMCDDFLRMYQLTIPPFTITNTCVSSIDAIGVASDLLKTNRIDFALVICFDYSGRFIRSGLELYSILNDQEGDSANGMKINGGYGLMLLSNSEEDISSQTEVLGYSIMNDGKNITSFDPLGESLNLAIRQTLHMAQITTDEIDCVLAGFNGVMTNDEVLYRVLTRDLLIKAPLIYIKKDIHHLLGASGLVESILALSNKEHVFYLIKDTNLKDIMECDIQNAKYILHVAIGFSGVNSAILYKKRIEV